MGRFTVCEVKVLCIGKVVAFNLLLFLKAPVRSRNALDLGAGVNEIGNDEDPIVLSAKVWLSSVSGRGRFISEDAEGGGTDDDSPFDCVVVADRTFCDSINFTFPSKMVNRALMVWN